MDFKTVNYARPDPKTFRAPDANSRLVIPLINPDDATDNSVAVTTQPLTLPITSAAQVDALRAEMFAHFQKEEQVLFPFIAQMEEATARFASPARACFQTVAQPVSMMLREHRSAEGLVAQMRGLTNEFKTPTWACPTHIALYAGLGQFERDLRQHVHLEDDILFPRAIEMESALNQRG